MLPYFELASEILLKILSMVLVHDEPSKKSDALKCLLINKAGDSSIALCQSFQSTSPCVRAGNSYSMPDGAPQLPLVKLSRHTLPLALSQRKEGKLRAVVS